MRRLIMSRLIWIYAVCKSLLLSPVAVKELRRNETENFSIFCRDDKINFINEIPFGRFYDYGLINTASDY